MGKGRSAVAVRLAQIVGVAGSLVAAQFASAADAVAQTLPETEQPVEGGMVVYIDPITGEVLPNSAPGTTPLQLSPAEANAFSTSSVGLVEVPNAAPGGGVKIDLRGRFQNPFVGVVGADGRATARHLDDLPWTGDKP